MFCRVVTKDQVESFEVDKQASKQTPAISLVISRSFLLSSTSPSTTTLPQPPKTISTLALDTNTTSTSSAAHCHRHSTDRSLGSSDRKIWERSECCPSIHRLSPRFFLRLGNSFQLFLCPRFALNADTLQPQVLSRDPDRSEEIVDSASAYVFY